MDEPNPFFPPTVPNGPRPSPELLASPGARVMARLMVWAVSYGPCLFLLGALRVALPDLPEDVHDAIAGLLLLPLFGWWVWQWHLLATTGQDLGKVWMGIRVIGPDGAVPGWNRVLVRELAWSLAVGVLQLVCIGYLISLADLLSLARSDRRTLHDQLADTRVVVA